jgi:hypothetical protein
MKNKHRGGFPLSHEKAVRYGKEGGSPLLLALRHGKRITIDGKRYIPRNK